MKFETGSPSNDIMKSENVFFAATGVTDGDWLKGVRYSGEGIETSSLVMRAKSGTLRCINAVHSQVRKAFLKFYTPPTVLILTVLQNASE